MQKAPSDSRTPSKLSLLVLGLGFVLGWLAGISHTPSEEQKAALCEEVYLDGFDDGSQNFKDTNCQAAADGNRLICEDA